MIQTNITWSSRYWNAVLYHHFATLQWGGYNPLILHVWLTLDQLRETSQFKSVLLADYITDTCIGNGIGIHPLKRWIFLCKQWRPKGFFQLEIIRNELALYDSFEYLCYRFTVIINIFTLTVCGSTYADVWRQAPALKGLTMKICKCFDSNWTIMSSLHLIEVVDRSSKTQLQVRENLNYSIKV